MKKPYIYLSTSSHGYLIVPAVHATEAILKGAEISECSRIVGREVYLEEDCDMPQFIKAMDVEASQIIDRHGEFNKEMYPPFKAVLSKQAQS